MKRRDLLKGAAGAGTLTSLAGCSDFLDDERPGRNEDNGGYKAGDPEDPVDGDSEYTFARQIQFIDNTGALGHVAEVEPDTDTPEEYENNRTEEEWQELENDLDSAKDVLRDGSYRRGVENYQDLKNEVQAALSDAAEDKAPERTIIEAVGFISDHDVVLPEASKALADDLIDSNLEMWETGATTPPTNGSFTHTVFVASYEDDGVDRRDYVDIGVPTQMVEVENPENSEMVPNSVDVRSPENTIYNQPEEKRYVAGFEFEKMMESARDGILSQEEEFNVDHPMQSISRGGILGQFLDMADGSVNDFGGPDNPYVPAITPEFGRSVEDTFYDDWSNEDAYRMKNVGRALNTVTEPEDGPTFIGVDGTLEEPEIYTIAERDDVEQIWDDSLNGEEIDLSEY